MSAGAGHSAESLVQRSFDGLAPKFREALEAALAECNAQGLDAYAYETLRSDELQALYYARGRTDIDGEFGPGETVTNAQSAQYGWHFFGLAADVISRSKQWKVTDAWRRQVNIIMRKHGLACGSDWPHPDEPHVYWAKCRRTPSDEARRLYAQGGLAKVWAAVGAD
jgi:hypothetical protein